MCRVDTVIFVESNKAGNACVAIDAARRLGFRSHFLTRDPNQYAAATANPVTTADAVTVVDTFNLGALTRTGLDIARQHPVRGVMAFDDYRVVPAVMLAEALGVNGPLTSRAVVQVRFKDQLRHCLSGTGLHTDFAVGHVHDWTASPIGYPCVTKPIDETASASVRVCRNDDDFIAGCQAILDRSASPNSRGYAPCPMVLVEQFLDGPEFSAEMAWCHPSQDWQLLGIVAKDVTIRTACVEAGHTFPHHFDTNTQAAVDAALRQALAMVGLRGTYAHIEFKMTSDGLRIVEVNARPPGGQIGTLMRRAAGIDVAACYVAAHAGLPLPDTHPVDDSVAAAGIRFVVPESPGTVTGYSITAKLPDQVETSLAKTPYHVPHLDSQDHRLGHVLATGTDSRDVTATLDAAVAAISMVTDARSYHDAESQVAKTVADLATGLVTASR